MDPEIQRLCKHVDRTLHAFKDYKNSFDPTERITGEMVINDLKTDHGDMLTNIRLYPDWVHGTVIGMDVDLVYKGKTFPIRFITQNPKKRRDKDRRYLTEYAKLVQQGHTITWVMLNAKNNKQMLGKIIDGVYKKNGEQTIIKENSSPMQEYVTQLAHELPTIPQEHIASFVQTAGKLGMLK